WSFLGVSASSVVWVSGILSALATLGVIGVFYYNRCLESPDGQNACTAGVVNDFVPSFDSAWNEVFPFTAMHNMLELVVKCDYWPLVELNALFIVCNDDEEQSPILQTFYESSEVCAAGLGALIGGAVGAAGGILLGALAAGAIGCTASGFLYVLCIIAVILVAALIAAAVTLAGAWAGGQIGKAAAEDSAPSAEDGTELILGDYISVEGKLITSGDMDGARVYWFAETTRMHGRSLGSPPFSHRDPDENLTADLLPSACQIGPVID
ncbi:MAG: hypothetical protein AAFY48_07660, partial [Bacteroidota bacterium]